MTHDDTPIETSEADARPWRGDVPAAEPSTPAAPIIGWHIRMRGCDGSADWIELGPERPTDVPDEADVLAVVHAEASEPAAQPATDPAPARWYCLSRIGMATLCLDEADAKRTAVHEDDLHPLNGPHRAVRLVEASQPATAPVVAAGAVDALGTLLAREQAVYLSRETVQRYVSEVIAAAPDAPVVRPAAQQGEAVAPLNGIKATMFHDEGAIAQCGHCKRYTLDRRALSDRQPVCDCGEQHYWSGSFKRPEPDARWFGTAPPARQAVALTEEQRAALGIVLDFYADDPRVQCLHPLMAGITPA